MHLKVARVSFMTCLQADVQWHWANETGHWPMLQPWAERGKMHLLWRNEKDSSGEMLGGGGGRSEQQMMYCWVYLIFQMMLQVMSVSLGPGNNTAARVHRAGLVCDSCRSHLPGPQTPGDGRVPQNHCFHQCLPTHTLNEWVPVLILPPLQSFTS